jgi:hypothetical protein
MVQRIGSSVKGVKSKYLRKVFKWEQKFTKLERGEIIELICPSWNVLIVGEFSSYYLGLRQLNLSKIFFEKQLGVVLINNKVLRVSSSWRVRKLKKFDEEDLIVYKL